MKFTSTKEEMPAPGQLIVKRWKSGAVWAGRYAGTAKDSSFDEWASLEPDPVIETCQLVGIKDGREVDLGDIPLPPELKAREICRSYGENPDDEDSLIAGALADFTDWLKKQGKLK